MVDPYYATYLYDNYALSGDSTTVTADVYTFQNFSKVRQNVNSEYIKDEFKAVTKGFYFLYEDEDCDPWDFENYVFYGIIATPLKNANTGKAVDFVRIEVDYKIPQGLKVDAFDPPNGNLFTFYGELSTGERMQFVYDISIKELKNAGRITMKFGFSANPRYVVIDTKDLLSKLNK